MNIEFEKLKSIPDASEQEKASIKNLLDTQKQPFVSDKETLAVFAFGGTIQSAYIPNEETIAPVEMNPVLERVEELNRHFGIAGSKITGATLIAKDSRDISNADMSMLVQIIREVENKKILVSCGTYMLPIITRVLDQNFAHDKSDKIIGVTGSMVPVSIEGQDADVNTGGTVAAINAFARTDKSGIVFAQFHGNIFIGDELDALELHRPEYNPRFARPSVDVR